MQSKLAAALELATRGYRVFPLVQNGKTPVHDGNWRKLASTDPARIKEMWTCPVMEAELDYNIGIALSANTLVVDVDTRDGKQGDKQLALLEAIYDSLPPTYTVDSANGGEHRYYSVEDSSLFAAKLSTDIDLKGEGGYVVGPGSTIEDRAYRARPETQRDPAVLPDWVRDHAPAGRRKRDDGMERGNHAGILVEADAPAAIARATEYLAKAAPDHGTYLVAAKVKDFGVSKETCLELMMEHWEPAEAKGQEHISFRVDNAYSYGQNAVGSKSPEAEFDAVEVDQSKAPPRNSFYGIRWENAEPDFEQQYLIDDLIDLGTMVVTYGDSNVGKTYVKLDQCFHIAAGKEWNGHKVKQGLVVYVAAEGGRGFLKRMAAFKKHYGVDKLPFTLVPCPIDLQSSNADTAKLVKLVREEETHFGQKCVLVVIDTLARAMGGGDENTAVDMSKLVVHSDRLRAATGATVDFIHHTGKDASKGARGSSALRAATDTEIEIAEGVFEAKKQRDMAKTAPLNFELVNVEVGRRSDGKPISACVVRWIAANEFDDKLSPQAEEMLAVLERLLAGRRDELAENAGPEQPDDAVIPWKDWEAACVAKMKGPRGKSMTRTGLYPLRQELADTDKIDKTRSNEWRLK